VAFAVWADGFGSGLRFGFGDSGERAEAFGELLSVALVAVVVPVDEVAAALEAMQALVESVLEAAFLRFAVDEQGVVFAHLLPSHAVSVVPEDGLVGLDGALGAIGNPDDAGARGKADDEVPDVLVAGPD